MTIDPSFVADLRSLFLDGATPTRLMRHIVARHAESGERPYDLVREYFAAAFHVGWIANFGPPHAIRIGEGRGYEHLNGRLLHEMVARRSEWAATHADEVQRSWLAKVTVTDDDASWAQVREEPPPPELRDSWASLSAKEREYINLIIVSGRFSCDIWTILAPLAERLQQRLSSAEAARGDEL